jgi:GntR family transcriptional regulator, rspAB operon transcriptional repressor
MTKGVTSGDADVRDSEQNSSLAAEAYAVVRQRILRGDLVLGQAISRRKLASELGMSFLPVSEALMRLEFEGLLESRPRAGTRVRIPAPEDVAGHYVVRQALEIEAAVLFARVATPSERADLRRLAARVDALSTKQDRTLYLALHQKLHSRIAEGTRCNALREAIDKTHALASLWFCAMRAPSADDSPTRHQDFVQQILGDDPARTADAVRHHLAEGQQRTIEVLQPYFRLRHATGKRFHRSDKNLDPSNLPTDIH